METPMTVKIENFKRDITELINNASLPGFAVDLILKDIYMEVHSAYISQVNTDYQKLKNQEEVPADE